MPGNRRLDMDVTEYEYVDTYPSETALVNSWPVSPSDPNISPQSVHKGSVDNVGGYGHVSNSLPGYGEIVADTLVHASSYSIAPASIPVALSNTNDNVLPQNRIDNDGQMWSDENTKEDSNTWSDVMDNNDEFSWSVQQYDNSVVSNQVIDNRLTQDYDDIDYTSGDMVSFHTSIAK